MGHRANYAVMEGGRVELFRSQWGALEIIRDVFFGPEPAIAVCRSANPVDHFMFDYWCEGAMLVDIDAQRLVFYGGDTGPYPELLDQIIPMVACNWPGWEVRWAHQGVVDLVIQLGLDPAIVHDKEMQDHAFDVPELKPDPNYTLSFISVRNHCSIVDYGFEDGALSVLSLGPALLQAVGDRVPLPVEKIDELEDMAFLDTRKQEIHIGFLYSQEDERVERLRGYWPGWTIRRHYEGLPGHFRLSDRDPTRVSVGREEVFRQIAGLIFGGNSFDPGKFLAKLVTDGEAIEYVHPDFLKTPQVELDEPTKQMIFVQTLTRVREQAGEPCKPDLPDS